MYIETGQMECVQLEPLSTEPIKPIWRETELLLITGQISPTIEQIQVTEQGLQPEHNPQPDRTMCTREEMEVYIEGIIVETYNNEIMVSGTQDQGTGLVVNNKLTVNINPGSKAPSNTTIIIEASHGQIAVMVTGQVVHEVVVDAEDKDRSGSLIHFCFRIINFQYFKFDPSIGLAPFSSGIRINWKMLSIPLCYDTIEIYPFIDYIIYNRICASLR